MTMRAGLRRRILPGAAALVTAFAGLATPSVHAAPVPPPPPGPLRIAVFGDSIIWGQGLTDDQKMFNLYASDLRAATGRAVEVSNYSHSGAPLSYVHPGTPDVFPGNCGDGNASPGEVPDPTTAVIDCQIPMAVGSHQKFDLVLLNGCVNDMGVLPPQNDDYRTATNVMTGSVPVDQSIRGYCSPALTTALRQAHALPGNPNVALLGYYPFVSQQTLDSTGAGISRMARSAASRSEEFSSDFDRVGNEVTHQAGPWATYVPSGIGGDGALMASGTEMFQGNNDPMYGPRQSDCAPYSAFFHGLCIVASTGHPNAAGDNSYRLAMDNSPAMQAWSKAWTGPAPTSTPKPPPGH
jgi:lysophospholipase L1-like esterase